MISDGLYWILDEQGEPQITADLTAWAQMFERDERRIVRQQRWLDAEGREHFVSTVFLGSDHSFGTGGPPVLWETMVFVDGVDKFQHRWCSRIEAIAGHHSTVRIFDGPELPE